MVGNVPPEQPPCADIDDMWSKIEGFNRFLRRFWSPNASEAEEARNEVKANLDMWKALAATFARISAAFQAILEEVGVSASSPAPASTGSCTEVIEGPAITASVSAQE